MRLMADFWEDERTPYCFSPAAARLGVEPAEMLRRLRYKVENKQLPNGAMRYGGGGMEDSVVVLSTLEEMMLQSYDGIVSLFPNWDLAMPARFTGWRASGAFVVDAQLEGGAFEAKIVSEKGLPLAVAVPVDGYELRVGDRRIPLARNSPSTVETAPGQVVFIRRR